MRRAIALALLFAVPILAGCFDSDERQTTAANGSAAPLDFHPLWHEIALTSGDDHDHTDFAQHQGMSTPNFEELGWDPLLDRDGTSPGGSSCGDIQTTPAGRIGVMMNDDSRGVVVADLTDPRAPRMVGELHLTATSIYDAAVLPGGGYLAMVTDAPDTAGVAFATDGRVDAGEWQGDARATIELVMRGPCGEHRTSWTPGAAADAAEDPIPRPASVLLVDVRDIANPEIVDQKPIQGLGHGVFATDIAGTTWVLTITENIVQGSRFFTLFELVESEVPGPQLQPISMYQADPSVEHIASVIGHSDGWLGVHPVTKDITGYFVAGTQMLTVDYSDPSFPTTLGRWTDVPQQLDADHNLHSIHAEETLRDGRHYTFLGPENGPIDGTPTGVVWVIDTTDPTQPTEVAAWTLPVDVDWSNGGAWSPHYLTVVNDTLFVSMYHGGVWATDISGISHGSPEAPHLLPSIGVYIPANAPPARPQGTSFPSTPNLFEVFAFEDGTMATFESNSGLYTFRFDAGQPAPAPAPWPVQPRP